MESTEPNICRLCFTSPPHLINIFNELDSGIADIIAEHIGEVNRSDGLPGCVCVVCWEKTNDFHEFHRSVHKSQVEYLKQIVKVEVENELESNAIELIEQPSFVEVITKCDEFSEYADENAIKSDNLLDDFDQQEMEHIESIDTNRSELPIVETVNRIRTIEEDDEEEEDDSDGDSGSSKTIKQIDPIKIEEIIAHKFDTTCDICSVDLKTLAKAISHYKHKHNINDGYIKCCGLKLKRDKLVREHIEWHDDPSIFKCQLCDRAMRTKLSLATHQAKHRHPQNVTCDICGKTFSYLKRLKIHMRIHARARTIDCNICNKPCNNKSELDEHFRLYHNPDDVRKQWDEFQKLRKTEVDAAEMERVMSTEFNMKCDYCDSVFKSLQEAQFHYLHEHDIAYGYVQCCGIKFKKVTHIIGHVLWHLRPELFKCSLCGKESSTVIALRSHLRVHESREDSKKNICEMCDKSFYVKHRLNRHLKKVHGINVMRPRPSSGAAKPDMSSIQSIFDMKCEMCETEFASLQHAKLHYLQEHDISDGYIKCCEMKFKDLRIIQDHLEYHSDPNAFRCTICFKTFTRKADLSGHISEHRAVETKKFTCKDCGKIWKSKYRLEVHKRSHQKKNPRTFPCNYCNRKFANEELRQAHTFRIHETDKEAKTEICEYCAKTFTTRKEVLAHIRSIHTENSVRRERAQCQICNAWLSNRYTLKEHMIRHNSEPQKCTQCDKISPNPHALLCHVREVHCDRIFQCHLCSKTFKAAVALKDHVATHTGEKMHKCAFCPEAFIWRPNMYSHQKKAHPEEWEKKKSEIVKRPRKS